LKSLRVSQHAFSHYVIRNALVFMDDTCVTVFSMTTSDFVIVINKSKLFSQSVMEVDNLIIKAS